MKRPFALLALAALATACGGAIGTVGNSDGGASNDAGAGDSASEAAPVASVDAGDLGDFCTGTSPRMMVNGSEISVVSATGKSIVLDCCDSAELMVSTSAYQSLFDVLWRAPAGTSAVPIELAVPPPHFTMEIDLGCDPATASCATASPEARFAGEFDGSIEVTRDGSGMSVSYCVSATEDVTTPNAEVHSLTLYAPNIPSGS